MKYQKPVLLVASALDAVWASQKGDEDNPDSPQPTFLTPGAYEADE